LLYHHFLVAAAISAPKEQVCFSEILQKRNERAGGEVINIKDSES
jgi:hypothetical protein